MKKRLIGIVLVLYVLCSLVPYVQAATIVDSGTFAQTMQWSLDSSGTFILSGEGGWMGYPTGSVPWYKHIKEIKKVIISDGITRIGNNAFADAENLETVDIANSVTDFGGMIFSGSKLAEINISPTVADLYNTTFMGCNYLENIYVDKNNPNYCSIDGVLYKRKENGLSLLYYPKKAWTDFIIPEGVIDFDFTLGGNTPLKSVNFPTTVKTIPYGMFYNSSTLEQVNIPNGVQFIGDMAFYKCTTLKQLYIPDSVTTIFPRAFLESAISDIYYSGSPEEWNKTEYLDGGGVYGSSAEGITIHYNAIGTNPPKITGIPTISNNKLNINLSDVEYDSSLITVFSDGNKMISSAIMPISASDTTKSVVLPNNGENQAKVFIWDSLEGMRPLCEAKTVAVK